MDVISGGGVDDDAFFGLAKRGWCRLLCLIGVRDDACRVLTVMQLKPWAVSIKDIASSAARKGLVIFIESNWLVLKPVEETTDPYET